MIEKLVRMIFGTIYRAFASAGTQESKPAITADELTRILRANSDAIVQGIRAGLQNEPRPVMSDEQFSRAVGAIYTPPTEMPRSSPTEYPPHEHDEWMDGPLDDGGNPDIFDKMVQQYREEHGGS